MGIPSFYRQLCRRFPALITKGVGPPPEWLCLDFNCAMYYVLRKMPPITEFTSPGVWEEKLCRNIAAYMVELCTLAAPTKGVYISCDGAVCAAKRRQQRLRRFKGPWLARIESKGEGDWDQNALTPGSAFMSQLGDVLVSAGATLQAQLGVTVRVSTTKEGGEGEHKLLAYMREVRPVTCTIYGLDADLILLSMLLGADTGADVRLMREAQEFEGGGDHNQGQWRSLSIGALSEAMLPAERVRDFVCAMSLLGNDFLPRSLTHTVRDDGIPTLIATLTRHVWSAGLRLVDGSGALNRAALLALVGAWAAEEERDLVVACRKAAASRTRASDELEMLPTQWASVCRLLNTRAASQLRTGWRGLYAGWRPGTTANYVRGVAWVWDYYSGKPVDQGWYYDEHLPPLWTDVAAYLQADCDGSTIPAPPILYPTPLSDKVHLLSVLPAASVERLMSPAARRLMAQMPWYWPDSWSVFDVGKSYLWECEPMIPMIPETVLRKLDVGQVLA